MNDIRSHLICEGFSLTCTNWIWHGELTQMSTAPDTESNDAQTTNRMEDMIRDLGKDGFRQAHASYYDKLETDSKMPMHLGCTSFTQLITVLGLVNLKARFRWSEKSFTNLLVLLKTMLPKDNMLPKSHYETKKILCPMGMEYQKIHACPNDYILYRNQFAKMHNYPTCGVSCYKLNNGQCSDDVSTNNSRLAKVCWYLPIMPRFKRFFANANDAKYL